MDEPQQAELSDEGSQHESGVSQQAPLALILISLIVDILISLNR